MKSIFRGLILLALLACVIQSQNPCSGQSNLPDTVILKTKLEKGLGLMYYLTGINHLKFKIKDSLKYDVILPANISDIKLAFEVIDYNSYFIQKREKGKGVSEYWKGLIAGHKIDTINELSTKENSVCFLKGLRGKEEVFIIDENNNKDFRDDPIRLVQNIDVFSKDNLIKCAYTIYNGKKYVKVSCWINMGIWEGEDLCYFTSQHHSVQFKVGKSSYDIDIKMYDSRFNFDKPQIALIGGNGVKRDTVLEGEFLQVGEYLKLKECVYKFADLSNDGSYLTLVREDHYQDISGTQIGVIAPAFKCHTTDGDSISLEDYKGRNVLLANISACYSVPGSQEVYKDLAEKYGSKLDMIVIDRAGGYLKQIENYNLPGRLVNADTPDNKEFAKNYRPDYCSRTCFLIGPDGRIVDKFEIFDWEKNLPKHLIPKN
jgi:hypothetical protein